MKIQEKSQLTGEVKIKKTAPVIPSLSRDLNRVAKVLKSGGVVIFPTDTVYGIGCLYNNQKAIDRIYKIKRTPKSQPFPILVSTLDQVEKLANVGKEAKDLIKKYWPGALTIILSTSPNNSNPGLEYVDKPGLMSNKVGFRMPDSDLVKTLIKKAGVPIVGTSANFHGQKTPRSFEDLDPNLIKLADFVIKGKCKGGVESTVIDATIDPPKILREGTITLIL